jgi:hypothetical protein
LAPSASRTRAVAVVLLVLEIVVAAIEAFA